MKIANVAAIAVASLLCAASAQTTAAPPAATAAVELPATRDADPALWVVKDRDTTIYLFGTVHVLKPGLSWFDEAVKAAFDKSDALVLEMVMPDPAAMQALVMQKGLDTSGTPLSDKIPAADRPAYIQALTELGAPAGALDRLKPWLAATEFSVAPLGKLGYDAANGPETVLTNAAKAARKPVLGLETPEQQFGYLDGLSDAAQMAFLTSAIKDMPKLGAEMDEMVGDWSRGDPTSLAKILNEDLVDQPELKQKLLTERNARWAAWIADRMKQPGTVFVAVGAGHLAGTGSVQDDLARHYKLTATRVTY